MREWSVRDVVLVVSMVGWMGLAGVAVTRGQPLPAMPLLPMRAQQLEPGPRRQTSELGPRAWRLAVDGDDDYGSFAVDGSADRCYGQNCKVKSLSFNGPGGTDIIKFANGLTIHSNNGDSNWIYSAPFRPSNLYSDGNLNTAGWVNSTTYFSSAGAALATGAVCPQVGALEYDTTGGCFKACNSGATWSGCLSTSTTTNVVPPWSSYCPKANCTKAETAADNFLIPYTPQVAVTPTKVSGNWGTAGTGGTTGVVIAIFDFTGASELCSVVLGPCTTTAGTPINANSGCPVMTAGHLYIARLKSTTDCATIPGLIGLSVDLQ